MSAHPETSSADRENRLALDEFLVENDDLQALEALLRQFNLFEALGAVRSELRHSDFLAFLLSPSEAHGLGDQFLCRLLQRALISTEVAQPVTAAEIGVLDFDDVEVRREWANIDILILDEGSKMAVVVENKVDTGEHSDQLARYWDRISREFPDFRILGLFLSPDGDEPSDARYISVDYGIVADLVSRLADTSGSGLNADVRLALVHYAQMLRRHIVSDSEIAELCRRIYSKHRRALDLIFEHAPDRQARIRELLEGLIKSNEGLVLDDSSKSYVRFAPKVWEPTLPRRGVDWTSSKRILLFEFLNAPQRLALKLVIGPGDAATRQRLFEIASSDTKLFRPGKTLFKKFNSIFNRSFAVAKEQDDDETVLAGIRSEWLSFCSRELPSLTNALRLEG